jgi:hypothetical protein
VAHIVWAAETADNVYELGTDTFVVRDGKNRRPDLRRQDHAEGLTRSQQSPAGLPPRRTPGVLLLLPPGAGLIPTQPHSQAVFSPRSVDAAFHRVDSALDQTRPPTGSVSRIFVTSAAKRLSGRLSDSAGYAVRRVYEAAWSRLAYACAWAARSEIKPRATNNQPQNVMPPAGAATRMKNSVVHGRKTSPSRGQIHAPLKARDT